jgi:hypothetical protein
MHRHIHASVCVHIYFLHTHTSTHVHSRAKLMCVHTKLYAQRVCIYIYTHTNTCKLTSKANVCETHEAMRATSDNVLTIVGLFLSFTFSPRPSCPSLPHPNVYSSPLKYQRSLSWCMRVYMYVCMHACMYIYMHT